MTLSILPSTGRLSHDTSFLSRAVYLLAVVLIAPYCACGQAPDLLWRTNVAARLFAVDAGTNAYANAGGTVIVLNANGVPVQTNSICPRPGFAQRDAAGNYYFAGLLPTHVVINAVAFDPQDFGGVVLSNRAVFLAKYTAGGNLLWATNFGPTSVRSTIAVTDFSYDGNGSIYVGYSWNSTTTDHASMAAKFEVSGSNAWQVTLPKASWVTTAGRVRMGGVSATNAYAITFVRAPAGAPDGATLSMVNNDGAAMIFSKWPTSFASDSIAATPVLNFLGELYNVEGGLLTKRNSSGALIWARNSGGWTIGRDLFGGVHVAEEGGPLSRYDYDGNPVWTLNLGSSCNEVILDAAGNRFFSLFDGTVGRIGEESLSVPMITSQPQGKTVLAGSDAEFTVDASGSTPLRYFWLYQNNALPGKTDSNLALGNVTSGQAGAYSVIVSNFLGSVTSAPAVLRVKSVAVFHGDELLTNGTYTFSSPPVLSIRSAFTNGSVFYSLDGSTPSFNSTFYSGAFSLSSSATIRAIGYSADFSQSEEADTVSAIVLAIHTLSAASPGGGSVTLDPPGGIYASTNMVTVTAVPSAGWSFHHWLGDALGTNPSLTISMEHDKAVHAVFATTLSTTVAGNGQILLEPPGGRYAYGSLVRLTGVPQPGSYLGSWGNAATGNSNPLYFPITTPNPTVSSIFGALAQNQVALTVLVTGHGRINVSPAANTYSTGQQVALTAVPDTGQSFVDWSSDLGGTQNPQTLFLNSSKVVTANFTSRPALRANRPGVEGLTAAGFRLTIESDPAAVYRIFGTTNFRDWQELGTVTNRFGGEQFTDPTATSQGTARFYQLRSP